MKLFCHCFSYIKCAQDLVKKCKELDHIQGASKLGRKCSAELRYLQSVSCLPLF